MAKNLFEQLLDFTGSIFSGPKLPDESDVYSQESSGRSGVEKYLQRQAVAAGEKQAAVTGVERYLKKHIETEKPIEVAEAPAKALTGVEKYLAKQAKTTTEKPAPAPAVTGVDKYLAII